MAKFLIDIELDGYNSEQKMIEASERFIFEQLNMTASSVDIKYIPKNREKEIDECLYD